MGFKHLLGAEAFEDTSPHLQAVLCQQARRVASGEGVVGAACSQLGSEAVNVQDFGPRLEKGFWALGFRGVFEV